MTALMFILGSALLIVGAESMVRGASRLAIGFGITPLVVGLTVVAFGTSAPELAVTIGAAASGQADVAIGNVVGSNIFNVLFILGLSALVAPLVVSQQLIRLDVPLMIVSSIVVLLLSLDGGISRIEGLVLFSTILVYVVFLVRQSRRESAGIRAEYDAGFGEAAGGGGSIVGNLAFIAAGLGLLVLGSRWLVQSAVTVATSLGVSELVIGLTVVAAGTSLPEVATSVLASMRGQRDIAVGNAVGSNLFNLLAVLGLGSIVAPAGLPVPQGVLTFDMPVMIGAAIACLPVFFTGYRIARWEGAVFLGFYAAYTIYLVLDASGHPSLSNFSVAMLYFVLPLTILTFVVLTLWTLLARRRPT